MKRNSKLDQIGYYDIKTGKDITREQYEAIETEEKRERFKYLERRFENDTISKVELEELMRIMFKVKDYKHKIFYDNFFKVNMCKDKPKNISDSDYGKFFRLLRFLSYKNTIGYTNGKPIKRSDLSSELGFSNIRSFNNYINKLKKDKMIAETDLGAIKYLIINPAYAQRNMIVDNTIFNLFKDDLIEYLNKYQIKLLELEGESVDIASIIPIED